MDRVVKSMQCIPSPWVMPLPFPSGDLDMNDLGWRPGINVFKCFQVIIVMAEELKHINKLYPPIFFFKVCVAVSL